MLLAWHRESTASLELCYDLNIITNLCLEAAVKLLVISGNCDVDLGTHWVGGDPLYSLDKEAGLAEDTRAFSKLFFVLNDGRILSEEKNKVLAGVLKEVSEDVGSVLHFDGSLGDYFHQR